MSGAEWGVYGGGRENWLQESPRLRSEGPETDQLLSRERGCREKKSVVAVIRRRDARRLVDVGRECTL